MAWNEFLDTMASSVPSLRDLAGLAFGGSQVFLAPEQHVWSSCPNAQQSCRNTSAVENLCCFNAPGGQISATQFWNSDPSRSRYDYLGPADSWTIHGLWPDHCDGTYDSSCDPSRVYHSISPILESFGKNELLSYMNEHWKGIQGDEHLWTHEWSKHGTCVSTLEPTCYNNYNRTEEVVDYFQRAVDVFLELPSYKWLADAGIVPSTEKTYSLRDVEAALTAPRGHPPVIACEKGELREIWYHFIVRGSLQSGDFVPIDPDWSGVAGGPLPRNKQCPRSGIKYLPKKKSHHTTTVHPTATRTHAPTGTASPFSGKGHLKVLSGAHAPGCIIGVGKWYAAGGCATFTASKAESGFTLSSRKGNCALKDDAFICASEISTPSVFTNVEGKLAVDGRTKFYAASIPRGTRQEPIYTSEHDVELEIVWHGA